MDLRINITKEQFAALNGFALGEALIRPAIQQARGKSLEIKKQVYDSLTPGQRALFGFWVLYGHTRYGWTEFFQSFPDGRPIGGYDEYLPVIKAGLRVIDDHALLENVAWAERLFTWPGADAERNNADEAMQASDQLLALLPKTMEKIEVYARARPEEFVVFRE